MKLNHIISILVLAGGWWLGSTAYNWFGWVGAVIVGIVVLMGLLSLR